MSVLLSILGLVLLGAGIIKGRNFKLQSSDEYGQNQTEINIGPTFRILTMGLGLILLFSGFIATVHEGNRGIVTTFKAAANTASNPGLNIKLPWQEMVEMSVRREIYSDEFATKTKDLQRVGVQMATVYQRNPEDVIAIYKRVKFNSEGIDIRPGAQEIIRAEVSKLEAPEVVTKRDKLSDDVQEDLGIAVSDNGLTVVVNSIQNVDYSPAYDHQVEEKVIQLERAQMEEENLRKKRTLAEINVIRQDGEGGKKKELARGDQLSRRILADAEAYKTRTEGLATAASTKIVGLAEAEVADWTAQAVAGNRNVLDREAIRSWNGQLPSWMSSPDQMLAFVTSLSSGVKMSDAPTGEFELAKGGDLDDRIEEFLKSVKDRADAAATPTESGDKQEEGK